MSQEPGVKPTGDTDVRLWEPPEVVKPSAAKDCLSCGQTCQEKVKRCKGCKSGCYCSAECREKHVPSDSHQVYCEAIQKLE